MICAKYLLLAIAGVSVPGQLPVKLYTTADGLPRNVVNCILQDSRGFHWLGTADGHARYFAMGDVVSALLEDHNGQLWAGKLRSGLLKLARDPVADRHIVEAAFTTKDGLMSDRIEALRIADSKMRS